MEKTDSNTALQDAATQVVKVSEEPWGKWTKTLWSDGQVLLHRPARKNATGKSHAENQEAVRSNQAQG